MTNLEDKVGLFEKIAQDYEKQLVDASSKFQDSVMAAQHEMERRISEWSKGIKSEDLKPEEE